MQKTKGFTLIELLIVIGILAVLATITVLVLNPAQLFAQARDSQRLSDLGSVKGALSLYLTSVPSPELGFGAFNCTVDTVATPKNFGASFANVVGTPFTNSPTLANAGVFTTDGSGWVAVKLDDTTGGSPLSTLPRDPVNDGTNYYAYACNNTAKTFELDAKMQSSRYACDGTDDVETTDGGDKGTAGLCGTTNPHYETGTEPGLDL